MQTLISQFKKIGNHLSPHKNKLRIITLTLLILLLPIIVIYVDKNMNNHDKIAFAKEDIKPDTTTPVILQTELLKAVGRALIEKPGRLNTVSSQGQIIKAAQLRKQGILTLLSQDPDRALMLILPDNILSTLNKVPNLPVEKKITMTGSFVAFHKDDLKNPNNDTFQLQLITSSGEVFNLFTNGRIPPKIKPGDIITVTGYQLDSNILLPPVPGGTVGMTETNPPVLGAITGPLNTAIIVGNFTDSTTPVDMSKIQAVFQGNPGNDVVDFFNQVSNGQSSIVPSYFGAYTLPMTTNANPCFSSTEITALQNQATAAGINWLNYRRFIYILNCNGVASAMVGEATINTPGGLVANGGVVDLSVGYAYDVRTYTHELGHNLGNWHASFFQCEPQSFVPPTNFNTDTNCLNGEYGDSYDSMGGGEGNGGTSPAYYDPYHRALPGWLNSSNDQTITSSGTYSLIPYESSSSGVLALTIPRGNSGTSFTVEYRQPLGFDTWMNTSACSYLGINCNVTAGASVEFNGLYMYGGGGGSDSYLIDNTPSSINIAGLWTWQDDIDGALLPGKTFTDPEYGISITTMSANSNGLTVQVTVPAQTCTHNAPSYSIANPNQSAAAGQTLNYNVTFTNNDSIGCGNNTFKISAQNLYFSNTGPLYGFTNNFTAFTTPDVFTLAPGASTTLTLSVTAPSNTPASTYTLQSGIIGESNNISIQNITIKGLSYQVTAPADTTPPTAPSNLTANAQGAELVNVSWSPSTDDTQVIGYEVLVNNSQLYFTTGTTWTDYNANPASPMTYAVQAYDTAGNLSPVASVTVTTPTQSDTIAPSSPKITSVNTTDRSITINWSPATDDTAVAGYKLTGNAGSPVFVSPSTTSYTFTNLETNTNYIFQVQAFDADGNYSNLYNWSSWQSAPTAFSNQTAPATPTYFYSPSGTANGINLAWGSVPNVTSYKLYRNWRLLTTVTGTSYTDSNITNTGNGLAGYSYTIKAVDANGNESAPLPRYFVPPTTTGYRPPIGYSWAPSSWNSSTDTTAPTIGISGITNGQTVSGTVNINSSATDNVGIQEVDLYIDGERAQTVTSSPYTIPWDTTQSFNGSHWIYVVAYDTSGNYSATQPLFVTVQNGGGVTSTPTPTLPPLTPTPTSAPIPTPTPTNAPIATPTPTKDTTPPTISITNPINGSTVTKNATVIISASASDNVGVVKVTFSVSGTLLCTDTKSPYTCSWKVPGSKGKSYTISATAYDAANNTRTSSITVATN